MPKLYHADGCAAKVDVWQTGVFSVENQKLRRDEIQVTPKITQLTL